MSIQRRSFLVACVGVVLGSRTSAVQAGPMEAIVDRVFATAMQQIGAGAKQVAPLLIGGMLIAVPILLMKELVDWLQAQGLLTDDVRAQLSNLRRELTAELKLPAGAKPEEIVRELARLEKKFGPKVLNAFEPATRERFVQIRRQLQGAIGMLEAETAAKLQLSDAQRAELKQIVAEQEAATRTAATQRRPLLALADLAAQKTRLDARARAVLTPAQQATWKAATGAPVRVPLVPQSR